MNKIYTGAYGYHNHLTGTDVAIAAVGEFDWYRIRITKRMR